MLLQPPTTLDIVYLKFQFDSLWTNNSHRWETKFASKNRYPSEGLGPDLWIQREGRQTSQLKEILGSLNSSALLVGLLASCLALAPGDFYAPAAARDNKELLILANLWPNTVYLHRGWRLTKHAMMNRRRSIETYRVPTLSPNFLGAFM